MSEDWAVVLVDGLGMYVALGFGFGLAFVVRGVQRIDPDAEQGSWGFRFLILPGCVALWPLLAVRWWKATHGEGGPPEEPSAHRRAAGAPDTTNAATSSASS